MTPERWQRIEQIYQDVMACVEPERTQFVERVCAEDVQLRDEVLALLAANHRAADFLPDSTSEADTKMLPVEQAARPAPILASKQIGQYQVLSELGKGGMGEVFLARDPRLDRKVALKMLPAKFTQDAGRLRRFEQEARAASTLNHPNIITIYEIGEAVTERGKAHFIATEFINGRTLRQLSGRPFGISETLEIILQVVGALAAAHQAGIVHRDIKPENLMLRPDGVVKVLDFGLAKLIAPSAGSRDEEAATLLVGANTAPGMILGTLAYMSPEQARGLVVDARSDIFSLGTVMYELLAGSAPFNGPTVSDIIAAILTTEPLPLTSLRPETPPELQRIVSKALRKNKDERYQTCQDLLVDLKDLKSELEFSAKLSRNTTSTPSHKTDPITPPPAASKGGLRLRRALLLLPVVLLMAVAIWWFVGRGERATFSPASLKFVEVTSWPSAPGEVYSVGAFSPDGQTIAFASTRSGSKNIWVKRTNSGEAIQITKDEFANENPIWSPNGDEIAFFSLKGNHPGIWRIPAFGGTPVLVATLQGGDARLRRWSKDGATIYFEWKGNLFALEVKSGQVTQRTNFKSSNINADSLSIAPDEQRVTYISTNSDGRSSVWVAPMRDGTPQQIANDTGHNRNAIWHQDSKRVFYSANVEGVYQIFVASDDGRPPTQVTFGDINSMALDVSSDGARILYGSTKEDSDVWRVNVTGGEEAALTSDLGSEFWPQVAPDGKAIAYQAVRNLSQGDKIANSTLVLKQTNSDESSKLEEDGALPLWSPDGKQIAFVRSINSTRSLWTSSTSDGQKKQLRTEGLPSFENTLLPYLRLQTSSFSWSPDSSRIAYCSLQNGTSNLWAVAADGSGSAQLTNNSDANQIVYCPLWSADGKRIAYSSKPNSVPAGAKLSYTFWVTEPEAKNSKAVFQLDYFARLIGWSAEDKDLILATFNGRASSARPADVGLVRVSVATGAQQPLATLPLAYLYNIHLSADKKTIAFTSRQDGKDNVWIIPVSGGEAKRLTANNDAKLYFSSLTWSPDGRAIYFGKQSRHSLLSMITNFK